MRILIADDEAIIRLGLTTMLEDLGHTVVGAAADGVAAVNLARQLQPDLVILDIKMPLLDGLDAAEEIAAERPVPILILSAYSYPALIERASSLAVQGYLVKPIRPVDLEPAIAIATARFEQWQELQREAADLREALATREVVEKAKRKLIETEKLSEAEAFQRLQAQARRERRRMREVAEEMLQMSYREGPSE
jgi:AmiR/NasT family two-component response regulator